MDGDVKYQGGILLMDLIGAFKGQSISIDSARSLEDYNRISIKRPMLVAPPPSLKLSSRETLLLTGKPPRVN